MPPPEPAPLLSGWLYVFVAFDWGDEIDLAEAARLSPGVPLDVSRRPRTPTSIAYKPPPLRFPLEPAPLDLPGLPVKAYPAEVIVFDFAAVSVAFRVPFHLSPDALRALAGSLTDQPTATGVVRGRFLRFLGAFPYAAEDPE